MFFLLSISFLSVSVATGGRLLPSSRWAAAFLLAFGASSPFSTAASSTPSPSLSPGSPSPTGGSATNPRKVGALDFAIVIPAILRLLENDHPAELHTLAGPTSPISVLQRVVLVSTLRSGFCMDLRLNPMRDAQAHITDWQVRLAALSGAAAPGARVEAFEGGWRVCARRAGHFELALQHAFSWQPVQRTSAANTPAAMGESTAIGWPVALSMTTP
jgi:hypothetical protein